MCSEVGEAKGSKDVLRKEDEAVAFGSFREPR